MTQRIRGMHHNILQIELCMDLGTQKMSPWPVVFSTSHRPEGQDHRKLKILLLSDSCVV